MRTTEEILANTTTTDQGCMLWLGYCTPRGYARIWDASTQRAWRGHRLVYEMTVGAIPDGLTLDHDCHTRDMSCPGGVTCIHRRCVNPSHLKPMTMAENYSLRRPPARPPVVDVSLNREICANGHRLTPETVYVVPGGARKGKVTCYVCRIEQKRAYERRKKLRYQEQSSVSHDEIAPTG